MLFFFSKKIVDEIAKTGRIWLRIVDKEGVKNIQTTHSNSLFICINPPSLKVLEQRLRKRNTDTENIIEKRLAEAKESIKFSKESNIYKYIIENDQLDVAYTELKEILRTVSLITTNSQTILSLTSFFLFRILK